MPRLFDAHNHLQDDRFGEGAGVLVGAARDAGVRRMVVNGSCEVDWDDVTSLADQFAEVIPSYGYHPWYVAERTKDWLEALRERLIRSDACVGEIGLDRWLREDNFEDQQEVFIAQLRLAAQADLPVTIHCLKAWGRLYDILRTERISGRGFLLHSYGGPRELVKPLARLGAYFSFPGYFAHERKHAQRAVFLEVPRDRLLVETDAPDQVPPTNLDRFGLKEPGTSKPMNHPANLAEIYGYLADFLGVSQAELEVQVEANFSRLFER